MKKKPRAYFIVIAVILAGCILGQEEEERREMGIISEMSADGTAIQVGSRYYLVDRVYIEDGTREEPVLGYTWNLEPGRVVIITYYEKNRRGSLYKAEKVILLAGKDPEEIIKDLEKAGIFLR